MIYSYTICSNKIVFQIFSMNSCDDYGCVELIIVVSLILPKVMFIKFMTIVDSNITFLTNSFAMI